MLRVDEESAARQRIRGQVADVAQQLASCVSRVVPSMAEMLGKRSLVLDDEQRKDLRRRSDELLTIHRRWVLYQSLLLHDWQSALPSRSSQEEALAQSFVDCLWRLHRCVRSLISRLRITTLLPDVSAGNASAAHFALARRKCLIAGKLLVDVCRRGRQHKEVVTPQHPATPRRPTAEVSLDCWVVSMACAGDLGSVAFNFQQKCVFEPRIV
eukprot:g9860.t1